MTSEFPCASCAKPIKFSASKCQHCGHKVTQADSDTRLGKSEFDGSALLGCIALPALIAFSVYLFSSSDESGSQTVETYRLIHAIGNTEQEIARGLSRPECQVRRDELKETATALGTYNDATGQGSITCLPERIF